tara:strand:- start:1429 stop:1611 length:183 start_codon:yes stop_codon:yes gene_type:complete
MTCCFSQTMSYSERTKRFQSKRLKMLNFIKDGIERRLSAINATIKTLEEQIERDNNSNPE